MLKKFYTILLAAGTMVSAQAQMQRVILAEERSEERRVGKEC